MNVQITLTDEQVKLLSKDLIKAGVKLPEPLKITDRVKTFDDALKIYQETSYLSPLRKELLNYIGPDEETLSSQASEQLKIIAEVLNEGWTPDWNNSSEYKYYPYFDMRNNTLVYSYCNFSFWNVSSYAGSRLCFKTSALAEYAGKQFIEIYKQSFMLYHSCVSLK